MHFNDEVVSVGHLNQKAVDNAATQLNTPTPTRLIPAAFLAENRTRFKGPIIMCGGLDGRAAEEMLNQEVDLVAFGLAYIANPDLSERLKNGWPLNEPKTELFYGGGPEGYTDYPKYTALSRVDI
jgi:N-ethylmaleimide reductase